MHAYPAERHLERVLAALGDPATFPHPVRDLHVIQTHVSAVALTGEFVYKVKKPVDFGFLDYGTLEKRRRCCEQEIRLNRRLSPEVYLDVIPLTSAGDRLMIGGTAEPIEWLVRMRQLAERHALSERLRTGTVGNVEFARLADTLADFHATCAIDAQYGNPDCVAANARENLEQLARVTDHHALPDLGRFAEEFLAAHQSLFSRRSAEGKTRDGHGDLRAQNICLSPELQGGIQILDCIEFNDAFRFGDVACDLAYLAMDLDLAGRRDLRESLIEHYVERSGDQELRVVLPFYLCYRAAVRAKIALLAANECEIPAEDRREHVALAAAALDLARSYASPSRPALWITCGYSGSGKSMLARELARRIPAVRISADGLRKVRAGVAPATRLGPEYYSNGRREQVYDEMFTAGSHWLQRGADVVLDATFLDSALRERARQLATQMGVELKLLYCNCPAAEIRARLARRTRHNQDASDAGASIFEQQLSSAELPADGEQPLRVDTQRPPNESVRWVLGTALWQNLSPARDAGGQVPYAAHRV